MRARVTVTPDVNILALYQMLPQNGLWLVKVHNGRIVSLARVPPEEPVESIITGGNDKSAASERDTLNG